MNSITFILMKTSDKSIGMLYEMIYSGQEVKSRKSLRKKIPYSKWNEKKKEVKSTYTDADKINQLIKERKDLFTKAGRISFSGLDKDCLLKFMESQMKDNLQGYVTNSETLGKYRTIYKNLFNVINKHFKMDSLPVGKFRDRNFVEELKTQMRFSLKTEGAYKSNKAWKSYMSVIATFIREMNLKTGCSLPVDTYYLTKGIGKDPKKKAAVLTYSELEKLLYYEPKGKLKRDQYPQLHAKNTFVFQYFTGGIRVQDALLLTNKQFQSNGIEVKIKKNGESRIFDYYYEMVQCLKFYYPDQFETSKKKYKIEDLELDRESVRDICCLENFENVLEMNVNEFMEVVKIVESSTDLNILRMMKSFTNILDAIKQAVMNDFFDKVRQLPAHFVLPYLDWNKFKDTYGTPKSFNREQSKLLHLARCKHNSNLKRVARNLGIQKMTGHTARHTLANHMNIQGAPITDIQNVLAHSSVSITQIYVQDRLVNTTTTRAMKTSYCELNKNRKVRLEL